MSFFLLTALSLDSPRCDDGRLDRRQLCMNRAGQRGRISNGSVCRKMVHGRHSTASYLERNACIRPRRDTRVCVISVSRRFRNGINHQKRDLQSHVRTVRRHIVSPTPLPARALTTRQSLFDTGWSSQGKRFFWSKALEAEGLRIGGAGSRLERAFERLKCVCSISINFGSSDCT